MISKIQSMFKKKMPKKNATEHLWELFKNEKYDEVIKGADRFLNHKSDVLTKDALKLTGLSLFRKSQYQEALLYFQDASKIEAEVNDWFNIVTSATLSRNIKVGSSAFDKAIQLRFKSENNEQPSIPFMRQYYACALRDVSEHKLALIQINELRKIYEQLKITDSTFLYLRGVPFLSHTMDVAVDVFKGLGRDFSAKEWIDDFAKKLDEEGQQYLIEVQKTLNAA